MILAYIKRIVTNLRGREAETPPKVFRTDICPRSSLLGSYTESILAEKSLVYVVGGVFPRM